MPDRSRASIPAGSALAKGTLVAPNGASNRSKDAIKRISEGAIEVYAENVPEGSPEGAMDKLFTGKNPILRGHKRKDVTAYAFGAQFVEVRVHERTREIRVPRMLGAFAAGHDRQPADGAQPVYGRNDLGPRRRAAGSHRDRPAAPRATSTTTSPNTTSR